MAQKLYCGQCGAYVCDGPNCNRGLAGGENPLHAVEQLSRTDHVVKHTPPEPTGRDRPDSLYFCSRDCLMDYKNR